MALVSIALSKSMFEKSHPHIKGFVLSYNPTEEKTSRMLIKKFLERHAGDKLLIFADKEKDKLGNLLILKDECNKAGIELNISLYCKNTNPQDEEYGSYFFREVDLDLSEELENMIIW